MTLQCPICQCQQGDFKIFENDCIFLPIAGLDQHLVRHQCPECGVIFGTQQMLNLSKEELKNAYAQLFNTGYRDGSEIALQSEIKDLLALNPNTDGVYLNWGAGASVAKDKAKELGYTLLNYDPFMVGSLAGYVNMDEMKNMKFDGIISHDLLEHLQDPIEELILMKSMLKPEANMIHSTPCYKYCHPYTKYHLFFFEGKSLDIICQKVGLTYEYISEWTVKYSMIKEVE